MAVLNLNTLFPSAYLNENYLHKSLGEEFSLCDNGNMVFHWADFHETCDSIKGRIESDPELREDFERRQYALSRLHLIPVWIRTRSKVQQTTMFDLYEDYIMNQSHLVSGLDPFTQIQLSFISGTGPFKSMAIAECFNKNTYHDFVLIHLLENKLPRRDFRIRLKSRILVEYGADFEKATLVQLEQLTNHGVLLSMDAEAYREEIAATENTRLLLDLNVLMDACGKGHEELRAHLSTYAFNLMYSSRKEDALSCSLRNHSTQSSFEFLKNKKAYLFVSYEDLAKNHPDKVKTMKKFVDYARKMISDLYAERKSA